MQIYFIKLAFSVILIPLALALAAGYISKNSADEMAELTGLFTILNLMLSLVLAPWQIQLLVLMVTFLKTRRLLQIQYKIEAEKNKQQ